MAHTDQPARNHEARTHYPLRWWHWVLMYPTLAIAIATAAPEWFDRLWESFVGVGDVSREEALTLSHLLRKNSECVASFPVIPASMTSRAAHARLCEETGDVLVQIQGDGRAFFRGFAGQEFDHVAWRFGIVGAAAAAVPDRSVPPSPMSLVPAQATGTLCQVWEDDRYFVRHVQIGPQCFDERYDSFTGQRLSQQEVPCRATC